MKTSAILILFVFSIACAPTGVQLSQTPSNSPTVAPMKVNFVEQSGQLNSLKEVVTLFPNKLLYIDIWASWCGPCRSEFAYKEELHKFIDGKEIELIYISVDKPNKKPIWEKMVNEFELAGHHIIANEKLKSDLKEQFYAGTKDGRKYLSLPNFVIVNKKGEVKEGDAYRPSDEKRLYKELKRFL